MYMERRKSSALSQEIPWSIWQSLAAFCAFEQREAVQEATGELQCSYRVEVTLCYNATPCRGRFRRVLVGYVKGREDW